MQPIRRWALILFVLLWSGTGFVLARDADPIVLIRTNQGEIIVKLFQKKAPVSCQNFLSYVKKGFYDGTIFHRVIASFMIQGGGYGLDLKPKPTDPPIRNEAGNGLQNRKWTLAMARTSAVHSATSQFFINLVNNFYLDHQNNSPGGYGYTVFGEVISGQEVVDTIGRVKTHAINQRFRDLPVEPVVIESVTILKEMQVEKPSVR